MGRTQRSRLWLRRRTFAHLDWVAGSLISIILISVETNPLFAPQGT
jgi:hypothetical protein